MKSLLTKEQESALGLLGMEQEEYWRENLPKMYKNMAEKGTLFPRLKARNDRMQERMVDLMNQGLQEFEAREFINEMMYDLEPEE